MRSRVGYWPDADVLIVQKRVDPEVLASVRAFRARGGTVVYDCDDMGKALEYWAPPPYFDEMLAHTDLVTTNTDAFRKLLGSAYGVAGVELVPDVVDYYSRGSVRNNLAIDKMVRVLWFGNRSNLHLLRKYVDAFMAIADCALVICCDETPELAAFSHPHIHYIPWQLSTFTEVLRSCHLTFLPHDGAPEDRAKSNNRMITSITWGVPAIVSRTPEYERLAKLIEQPHCLIDHSEQLAEAIAYWRSEQARARYLDAGQPVVWRRHSPDAVARRICELLHRYRAAATVGS